MIALSASDIHVWYRNTTLLSDEVVNAAGRHLSTEECARRDRFHFEADRRDFTVAHDLLRRTLSFHRAVPPADWRFVTNAYGKPSIDSIDPQLGALSFSLSHTLGCVACATTCNAPVGIDLERTDRSVNAEEIADRYFSEHEAAWLRRCSDETYLVRFTELWTLKEAFLKALGVGLSGGLTAASFRFEEPCRIVLTGPSMVEPREWHFALFDLGRSLRLGVAVRGIGEPHFTVRQEGADGVILDPVRVSQ